MTALIIIDMTWQLWVLTVGLVVGGGILFYIMMFVGEKLVQRQIRIETEKDNVTVSDVCAIQINNGA